MEMRNPTRVVFFAADTGRCPAPGEGLFLFQSVRYEGIFSRFFAKLSLIGTPIAVVVSAVLVLAS